MTASISKDAILLAAYQHSHAIYWMGVFTACLTAFYVSRAMFMTFFGSYRGQAHPHESPAVMWVPLAVLAVFSLAGGWLFPIPEFLKAMFPAFEEADESLVDVHLGFRRSCRYWPGVPDLHGEARHGGCPGADVPRTVSTVLQQILRGRTLRRHGSPAAGGRVAYGAVEGCGCRADRRDCERRGCALPRCGQRAAAACNPAAYGVMRRGCCSDQWH